MILRTQRLHLDLDEIISTFLNQQLAKDAILLQGELKTYAAV